MSSLVDGDIEFGSSKIRSLVGVATSARDTENIETWDRPYCNERMKVVVSLGTPPQGLAKGQLPQHFV